MPKDVALVWLEENKNFREEAKVYALCRPIIRALRAQRLVLNHISLFSLIALQETRDKVKLLLQLADTLLSSGSNVHTQAISHWSDNVDLKYKDFSSRIEQLKYAPFHLLTTAPDSAVCVILIDACCRFCALSR